MSDNLNKVATKAGAWYIIGNLLLKGIVFFSLPIFTRIMSPDDFGIYNAYMAYEGILAAVIGLGIYGSVKNAKFDFEDSFDKYISSAIFMSFCAFAILLVVVNITYPLIASTIKFSRLVTNCLLFQSFGATFIQLYGAKLNIEFKYKSFLAISIFNSIGSVLLSIVLILFVFPNERYIGRVFGSMLPPVIVLIVVGGLVLYRGKCLYNKKYWNYIKRISLPLVPHVISQSILSQFDRIMIRDMIGASEAGVYSYMYTICTITYVLSISLDSAWTPWLYYKLKEDKANEVQAASSAYMDLFTIITIGFVSIMPEVSKLLADEEYWSGIDLLIPLSLANFFIFSYFLPVSLEYYHKKTKLISIGTIAAALTNLLLNFCAIKMFGYKAAAYTTAISYFLLFLFHSKIAMRFNYKSIFNLRHMLRDILIVILLLMVIGLTYQYFYLNLVLRYVTLLALLVIACMNRKVLISLLRRKTK